MNHYIRKLRVNQHLSQSDVAQQLGISQNAYSRIERGLTRLSAQRLQHLADIFGISMQAMLEEQEKVKKQPAMPTELPPNSSEGFWIYEKMIQHKDETIQSMRETIQILKEQLDAYKTLLHSQEGR